MSYSFSSEKLRVNSVISVFQCMRFMSDGL